MYDFQRTFARLSAALEKPNMTLLSEAQKDELIEDLEGQLGRAKFEMDRLREANRKLLRENGKLKTGFDSRRKP